MPDEIKISQEFQAVLMGVEKSLKPGGRIAIYQNQALDSSTCGKMRALKVGPGYTCQVPPETLSGCDIPVSWAYCFVGYYDSKTGTVVQDPPAPAPAPEENHVGQT